MKHFFRLQEFPSRTQSAQSLAFGLCLPRGTILRAGDFLVLDEVKTVVVVERPEPAFLIEPRTSREWGLYAYHIGNRHQPLMITERESCVLMSPAWSSSSGNSKFPLRARSAHSRRPPRRPT